MATFDVSEGESTLSDLPQEDPKTEQSTGRSRALDRGRETIHVIGDALDCSDGATSIATTLLEQASDEGLLEGRNRHVVGGACLYHAARSLGETRTPSEIAETHDAVDRKRLTSAIRYLSRELSLKTPPPRPEHHVEDFADRLGLDGSVRTEAAGLIETGRGENVTSGQAPTAVAAGALYAASCRTDGSVTQREVADACDVSEVSIRNHYRNLIEAAEQAQRYQNQPRTDSDATEGEEP